MKMYSLLKKELLLAGDSFWLSAASAIGVPIFLSAQGLPRFSSVYMLLIGVSFSCCFLFSSIFAMEDKYKGNLYLMVIPYKGKNIVETKYLLAVLIYIFTLICCQAMSFTNIQGIALIKYKLTLSDAAIVFFIISMIWSIFFPLYYCFSYGKIKAALIVIMLIVPTCALIGLDHLAKLDMIHGTMMIRPVSVVILILFSMIIMRVSIEISCYFLQKRNL